MIGHQIKIKESGQIQMMTLGEIVNKFNYFYRFFQKKKKSD